VSVDFLNRMLEAERAGAKALVVFMDAYERNSTEWKLLRRVHEDEAHNCALIGEQLKKLGCDYSHATGGFYAKAVAVQGKRERLEFLVRGLKWAVREFDQALPGLENPEVKRLFLQMRERHLRSITAISDGLLPG
jgi:nitronate monooxygenase